MDNKNYLDIFMNEQWIADTPYSINMTYGQPTMVSSANTSFIVNEVLDNTPPIEE